MYPILTVSFFHVVGQFRRSGVQHGVPVQLPLISGGSCLILITVDQCFGSGFSIVPQCGSGSRDGIFERLGINLSESSLFSDSIFCPGFLPYFSCLQNAIYE